MVRDGRLRDHQIAGKSLEPNLPPVHGNVAQRTRVMTSGMVKTVWDWIIRSQVLRVISLRMQFND